MILYFRKCCRLVNDNYVDETFNGNDWKKLKEEYSQRLVQGADEKKLTGKMLSLLGDKYSRLLDKAFYESLWKYDAIGGMLI
jgi:C-terminal processing protease CtpA/Prc